MQFTCFIQICCCSFAVVFIFHEFTHLSICCCCKFYFSHSTDVVNSIGAVTKKPKNVEKSAPYPKGCLSANPAPLVVTAEKEVKQKHQLYVDF